MNISPCPGPIDALLGGLYDGVATVGSLKTHGDLGIGTKKGEGPPGGFPGRRETCALCENQMEAGHGGSSGRYQQYRDTAEQIAFLLNQLEVR